MEVTSKSKIKKKLKIYPLGRTILYRLFSKYNILQFTCFKIYIIVNL